MAEAPNSDRTSLGACLWILVAVAAGVFLVGGANEGALGVVLVATGLALFCFPPRVKVEGKWWILLLGLLVCGAFALLPAAWSSPPAWRVRLQGLPIPLGGAISPVPDQTQFYLLLLGLSGVFFLFLLSHPLRSGSRLLLATCGVFVGAVYAGLAIYGKTTGWEYGFSGGATFGFFPNRNHTAAFLVTSCLLALGIVGVGIRQGKWWQVVIAVAGMVVCGTALLVYSESRGGVAFLVVGTLLWVGGLGRRHWTKPLLISFVGLFLAGLVFFYVAKSEARNRLVKQWGSLAAPNRPTATEAVAATSNEAEVESQREVSVEGRLLIYRDTWRMILDAPLAGVGLGAFRYVYLFYQKDSLSEFTSIHPESDWMMLAAEMGLPGLAIFLITVALSLGGLRRHAKHAYWPLRWGVVCAALAAILHGMVDVPAHRMTLGWWILFFFAIGVQGFPKGGSRPPIWQRLAFWAGGLAALGLGIFLIRAEWWAGAALPPRAAKQAENEIFRLFTAGDLVGAVQLSTQAIARHPMSEGLYYQKALLRLQDEGTDAEADGLFAAQRALSPNWPKIPIDQGTAWLGIDTGRTATLWLDALERKRRIGRAQGTGEAGAAALYAELLVQSRTHPELQVRLREAAGRDPAMLLIWLREVDGTLATKETNAIQANPEFLRTFPASMRGAFLQICYERADREWLWAFLEKNPTWEDAAWPLRVRRLVDARDFPAVVPLVAAHYRLDLALPRRIAEEKLAEPGEDADPMVRFDYFWKTGNAVTARRILAEVREQAVKPKKLSPEIWKKSAELAIADQDWAAAWIYLSRYLVESGLDTAH